MKIQRWLCVFMLTVLLNRNALAQTKTPDLTTAVKTEVIGRLSSSLLNNYVFPDTGRRMAEFIGMQLKSGAYDKISSPDELAAALTAGLHSVYKDLHLMITYNHHPEKGSAGPSYMQQAAKQLQIAKWQNYGFSKAEVLTGNIGYLAIDQFFPVNGQSTEIVKAAFSFFKNTDALIIDLRNNPGGDAFMVNYISSYFFKEKTHINDMYDRSANQVYQYWTELVDNSALFSDMPVYVLVNAHTFSGAEGFAYGLQSLHRAIVVGETTGGAAHPVSPIDITNGFTGYIPFARAISPVTRTNWEAKGVKPDIIIDPGIALETARQSFYRIQARTLTDPVMVKSYQMMIDILNAKLHPFLPSLNSLKKYTGNYDRSMVTIEKDGLFFTPSDGYKVKLNALSQSVFFFNNWKLEFILKENGTVSAIELTSLSQDKQILKRKNRGKYCRLKMSHLPKNSIHIQYAK